MMIAAAMHYISIFINLFFVISIHDGCISGPMFRRAVRDVATCCLFWISRLYFRDDDDNDDDDNDDDDDDQNII